MLAKIEFSTGIENAWSQITTFVPKLVAFFIVLLIGSIVVRIIVRVVGAVLKKIALDRVFNRGVVGEALTRSQLSPVDLITKIVRYALLLILLQTAFGVFGRNTISDVINKIVNYLPHVAVAIVIVVVGSAIAAAVKDLVASSTGGTPSGPALASGASIAVMVISAFAALGALQVAPSIVNGLFYAVLTVIVGSAIIAIGGGGIVPMRARWERALQRFDSEMSSRDSGK